VRKGGRSSKLHLEAMASKMQLCEDLRSALCQLPLHLLRGLGCDMFLQQRKTKGQFHVVIIMEISQLDDDIVEGRSTGAHTQGHAREWMRSETDATAS
jgi:hypothetical protein